MKRKLVIGAVVLVVIVAIFGVLWVSTSERDLAPGSIKLLSYETVGTDQTNSWRVELLFTNQTTKLFRLQSPFVQTRTNGKWVDYAGPLDPERDYEEAVPPHGTRILTADFSQSAPSEKWRLRIGTAQQFKGIKRMIVATRHPRNFAAEAFGTNIAVIGKPYVLFSEEFAAPQLPH